VAGKARPPISIDVKEAEVHNVFRLLARAGAINIVVPEHVRGRITLHLEQVPWEDALNAVLFTAGLGQVQQENVLYIDTLANLQAQAKARAAAHAAQVDLQPTETQIIPLSYARADELKRIVEQSLSPRGTVTVDMRTNSLIITDVVNSRAFSVAP